jgi:branched-chain amino acid transport system ATP-binding protein
VLSIEDAHVSYATAGVLRGVDLHVGPGETVSLLGRNGMGKTTLVRAVCGLTPPLLTQGRVLLDGQDITGWASHRIARAGIGLVPQGRRVFGSLTVEENLTVVATGKEKGWTVKRVYDFFPRLADRSASLAGALSGGEQQMLAIGRALMTNPRMLVMDEPSEGLAPAVLDTIRDRLAELSSTGLSVLVAEQNVDLALDLGSRAAILGGDGTIAWAGTTEELRQRPEVLTAHLGVGV